jgi:hypothetical protein
MTIDPVRLAENVLRKASLVDANVIIFWFEISSGRGVFAEQLREHFSNTAAVVYELKASDLFGNPNALQSDVTRVISDCRIEIQRIKYPLEKLSIVILSKSKFHLPLISSPADLPIWYPEIGGTCVHVPIIDLSWSADGNLKSPEVDSNTVSMLLYDFNAIACKLLKNEYKINPLSSDAFIQAINDFSDLKKKNLKYTMAEFIEIVENAQLRLNRIGYRPSAKNVDSIIAVLMRLSSSSTPDDIHKKAAFFARAIGVLDTNFAEGNPSNLLATLFRSTNPDPDPVSSIMREVFITIFFASQLTTASAHADGYGFFSLKLLSSISNHIVELLSSIVDSFNALASSSK